MPKIKCPNCKTEIEIDRKQIASLFGSLTSERKAISSRLNARKRWEIKRLKDSKKDQK